MPITPADWPAISALLDEALALAPAARERWLQSLEGDRALHRDAVRALLAQAAGVDEAGFMDTLPRLAQAVSKGDAGTSLTELAAGDSIGPYRLLSELGTGGMGTVWLAERADGALRRKVALKLPRLVWARGIAERMARERDILASLEHPHIARLYDAGLDQHGRPYLALELVEGQPIDVYARAQGLSVRRRLELLLQVCSAVAYAHSRLVVHRDLKPGNILVTPGGEVRLLDFGIAKLMTDDGAAETQLTRLAGRPLTLHYASPEQIKGEPIGTASDVYSLGVVAYELLTGATPYKLKRGSAAELEEAIATADAAKASDAVAEAGARKALRGDLDAILNKALKKRAQDRYPSVDAFSSDLARYLSNEPVTARPDSFAYRAGKFMHRYRLAVGAGGVMILAVSAAAVIALLQAREATAQRDRALLEVETTQEVSRFVVSLFEVPDPPRTEIVDRGRDRVLQGQAQPSGAVRARMLKVLGDLYVSIGQLDKAIGVYEEAIRVAALPAVADHRTEAEALVSLGFAQANNALNEPARQHMVRALAIVERHAPGETDLLARAHIGLGVALTNLVQYEEARPHLERGILLLTQLHGPQSRPAITARKNLARLNFRARRDELGLTQMREVLADMRQHLGERDPAYIDALDDYGSFLNQAGRLAESRAVLPQALAARTAVYGPDHPTLTAVYAYLGHALVRSGRPVEAVPLLKRSIELEIKGNPRPTPYIAFQNEWLFRAHLMAGDVEQAERSFAAGLKALSDSGEDAHSRAHLRLYQSHALENLTVGRRQAAVTYRERILELSRQHQSSSGLALSALLAQAWPAAATRAEADARVARLDALLLEAPDAGLRTVVRLTQARLRRDADDLTGAVALYEDALQAGAPGGPSCGPGLLPAGLERAEVLQKLGRGAEAKSVLTGLAPCAEAMDPSSPWSRRWQQGFTP